MKRVLSIVILSTMITSASAQSFMERLRDKYLYSDYEIEGVEQSYNNAHVYVPGNLFKTTPDKVNVTKKYPVVIYLHGCTGIVQHDYFWAKHIADMGFIVVQPDNFARPNAKAPCNDRTYTTQKGVTGGMTLMQRQQEIKYALEQVKQSQWADTSNVFLMGHSQGGVSTALTKINDFKGLIISGWTCTSPLLGGIKSENSIPVLAISFDRDPWYYGRETQGRCADVVEGRVNFTQLELSGASHGTSQEPEAKASVSKFLKENTNETR